ncbi:MAG: hypothetical protein WD059_03810 [Balneolaceae bacterium]
MSSKNKGFTSLCIPLLTLLILFTGCEDPGSVGGEFIDKQELTFDTLSISGIQTQSFSGYTGRLNFVTMGKYSDPIFGDIDATAILKPDISASLPEGDQLHEDYSMKLELVIDSINTYGDTFSEANYTIYEVASQWNGATYRFDSELDYNNTTPVGTFNLNDEGVDTVVVDLSDEWKDVFAGFYHNEGSGADSSYRHDFHGLALVADDGTNKISFPNINSSRFLAINNVDPDTTNFSIRDWAYTLDRTGETTQEDVSVLHTTLEKMLLINLDEFLNQFVDENFIRAEILLQEATEELELLVHENRLGVNSLRIDIGYEEDPAYEFQLGGAETIGFKDSDNSFRINLTNYLNNSVYGSEDRTEFYIGVGSNTDELRSTGILRSTLIYNETASEALRPKIIITSLTGDEE